MGLGARIPRLCISWCVGSMWTCFKNDVCQEEGTWLKKAVTTSRSWENSYYPASDRGDWPISLTPFFATADLRFCSILKEICYFWWPGRGWHSHLVSLPTVILRGIPQGLSSRYHRNVICYCGYWECLHSSNQIVWHTGKRGILLKRRAGELYRFTIAPQVSSCSPPGCPHNRFCLAPCAFSPLGSFSCPSDEPDFLSEKISLGKWQGPFLVLCKALKRSCGAPCSADVSCSPGVCAITCCHLLLHLVALCPREQPWKVWRGKAFFYQYMSQLPCQSVYPVCPQQS